MSNLLENTQWQNFEHCRHVGIFDSGVGGLSILRQLTAIDKAAEIIHSSDDITKESKQFIYVADTDRFPYGNKTSAQILLYTQQIVRWLESKHVDLIIFGCNTASAIAGKQIHQMTNLPVLDLIQPTASYLGKLGLKTGVLATQATVNSHVFADAIRQFNPKLQVEELASAQLVNIVETGRMKSKETEELLNHYIEQFSSSGTEIIVLGCTHFSFLKEPLARLSGKKIQILDPADLIKSLLLPSPTFDGAINEGQAKIFVTGNKDTFINTARSCLGYPLKNVNHLSLNSLTS